MAETPHPSQPALEMRNISKTFGPIRALQNVSLTVYVGESHRGFLGTGSFDWISIFDALANIGYAKDISFESFSSESFSSETIDEKLSRQTAILRNLWSNNMKLAKHARGFIEIGMETARLKSELVKTEHHPQ